YYGSLPKGFGANARATSISDSARPGAYPVGQVATTSDVTLVVIPRGARVAPPQFNVTELLTDKYAYPFNFTVVVGVNNTIQWMNNDTVDHTVSSFVVPDGAQTWSSGLIPPQGGYAQTLVV